MNEINRINDRSKFINYFPNYLPQKNNEKPIQDIFLFNNTNSVENLDKNDFEINSQNKLSEDKKGINSSNIPVNLFIEEEKELFINNKVNKPFGPTNLPKDINEIYINPRYL